MTFDLQRHGQTYAPEYPPHGNSDHLPMAWLALRGLGADDARLRAFAERYLPRLRPHPPGSPIQSRAAELEARMRRAGVAEVLAQRLPSLVCGWHREAYHPLIRLAFGVEFGVLQEAAAGLAYLEHAGPSPRLSALAAAAEPDPHVSALALFQAASRVAVPAADGSDFTARAEQALGAPEMPRLARVVPDNERGMCLAALGAFAATHDFFALHLVTASHAFRVLRPWAGPDADAVLNLGLLAGYLAIGAPRFPEAAAGPGPVPTRQALLEACHEHHRDDPEHRIKLAYACWRHAEHWREPVYLYTAKAFLERPA